MKNKKILSNFYKNKIATTLIFSLVAIFVFALVLPTLALDTGLQYGTYTGLGSQDIRITVMKIVRIALGLLGIITLLIMLYAGFLWTSSAGNPEKIETAKKTLQGAAIGLVIIFLSFSIVSFIIGSLNTALGGQQPSPGNPISPSGELGSGVVESVYPAPYAEDVVRNTNIMVTFKIKMRPGSIITGVPNDPNSCTSQSDNPCKGQLDNNSVEIYKRVDGVTGKLAGNDVAAYTTDGKTFIFDPSVLLGDGIQNVGYSVTLTGDIKKDNGESAFAGNFGDSFTWSFDVGTFLDLDPVEFSNVFPYPDDSSDVYSQTVGRQATVDLTINSIPRVATDSSVSVTKTAGNTGILTVSGTYSGTYSGLLTATIDSGDSTKVNLDWDPALPSNLSLPKGLVSLSNGGFLVIGNGISLTFSQQARAEEWKINFKASQAADTFVFSGKNYTFVSQPAGSSQIQIGETIQKTAENIANKLEADLSGLIGVSLSDDQITVNAKKAEADGNNITYASSGSWLNPVSGHLEGGTNSSLVAQKADLLDQPRNSVIKLEFNEAINPVLISSGSIKVEYDKNPDPEVNEWTAATGNYLISNQYQTVEFLSNSQCGVCSDNGQPCSDDTQCGAGGTCGFISNSCGDQLYCLPVLQDANTNTTGYDATHYRVIVKAGLLKDCTDNGCSETNYSSCVDTPGSDSGKVCSNKTTYDVADNFFYPETSLAPAGITDAAGNSFNGNQNIYTLNGQVFGNAQGPSEQSGQGAYNLNSKDAKTQGDDLIWSFYINKQVKLAPPQISQIGPNVGADKVSLSLPVSMSFDGLMFGATIKPGTGYPDGFCGCRVDDQGNSNDCAADEFCDVSQAAILDGFGKCVNRDVSKQQYCSQDKECGTNLCINKKYLTLVDLSTKPIGFWVTEQGVDVLPQDGYADFNIGQIQHAPFSPLSNYGAEVGSGVKDIYQNCYLPSEGPSGAQGKCSLSKIDCSTDGDCTQAGERCEGTIASACNVTPTAPYCCNGQALPQRGVCSESGESCAVDRNCSVGTCSANWEGSSCFTSY
ncbi:MAG: Ig-like domain-containing protein [Candidatus Buchananbacteria bacterium]|nr:Ig-like domain-containing protein [Candidatus Buchananbacteria bacterium]